MCGIHNYTTGVYLNAMDAYKKTLRPEMQLAKLKIFFQVKVNLNQPILSHHYYMIKTRYLHTCATVLPPLLTSHILPDSNLLNSFVSGTLAKKKKKFF